MKLPDALEHIEGLVKYSLFYFAMLRLVNINFFFVEI